MTQGCFRRKPLDTSPERAAATRRAVARAKRGDERAMHELYELYADNVYGYVASIVRDEHEAEDVTQQVFVKLLMAIRDYEDRGAPFTAWILRVARNLAVDHVRKRRSVPCEEVPAAGVGLGHDDRERTRSIKAALSTLPQDQCEVIVLRHFVGLSPGEIAARIGRTEGAVHGLHHRGRSALKRELINLEAAPAAA